MDEVRRLSRRVAPSNHEQPLALRVACLLLAVGAVGFIVVFVTLAARLGYPEMLDHPASEVLPAGGPSIRTVWVIHAVLPLTVSASAWLASWQLGLRAHLDRATRAAGVLAGLAMTIGLSRWSTLQWSLAERCSIDVARPDVGVVRSLGARRDRRRASDTAEPMIDAREVWLLPGMDGTGRLFARLIDALGDDGCACRVFEYGDGVSYDALLERLPSPNTTTIVVGESFGGPLAILLAAQHPGLVAHVVLVASFARAPRPLLGVASVAARVLPTPPAWAIERAMVGRDADAALTQAVREAMGSVRPATTAARVASLASLDVRETVASTSMPVTALVATRDRLVPRALAEEPARLAPRGRVIAIEGPHLLAQARPRAVADVIRDLVHR